MERTRTIQRNRQKIQERCKTIDLLRAISNPEEIPCYIETGALIKIYNSRTHYRHNREKTIPTRVKYHRHYRTE